MQDKRAYPYPEIVTGDKWHVLETTEHDPQPRTDNLNKQMYVPMDRDCEYCGINHSRMIRRHELGHAKWSPKTMGKLLRGTRAEAIHALEEVRINYLLAYHDLPIDDYLLCREEILSKTHRLIMTSSIADLILYILAAYSNKRSSGARSVMVNTDMYQDVLDVFQEAIDSNEISELRKSQLRFAKQTAMKFIGFLTNHAWNQLPSYRKVQKYAEKLSAILAEFMDKPKPEEVKAPPPEPETEGEEGEDEESEGDAVESASTGDAVEQLEKRMRKDLVDKMTYNSSNGIGQWGDMTIHEPPLSVNLQGRLKQGRAYRPSDYGYNPKYINRYCIDKQIFKQKVNVKGGTILIDASGSMSFNGDDILEIMQMLPAVNIAMYNGWGNSGTLRIIAKNGMRVTEEQLDNWSGGGNVVDGPALRWLSTMPARRIWVSDMHVFGVGRHSSGFNLLQECYQLCTQHKIINLKDIEEVKEHALKLNQVL